MQKYFHNFIFGVSVLPALLVMPAMAETIFGPTSYDDAYVAENQTNSESGGVINVITGPVEFNSTASFSGNSSDKYGGAIMVDHVGTNNTLTFNKAATFVGNHSVSGGGAVYSQGDLLFNSTSSFTDNYSSSVGALSLSDAEKNAVFKGAATFINNGKNGDTIITQTSGALGNAGTMTFEDTATFIGNAATVGGAAIGNSGTLTFQKGLSVTESKGSTALGSIRNSGNLYVYGGDITFSGNEVLEGGGIRADSGLVLLGAYKEDSNVVEAAVDKINFINNTTGSSAGALKVHDKNATVEMYANEIKFDNNTNNSNYGGAVFNAGDLKISGAKNTFSHNTTNATFSDASDLKYWKYGGGAIQNRGNENTATLIIGTEDSENVFEYNESKQHGGAIYAKAIDGENQDSVITINGETEFKYNIATYNGGAIANYVNGTGGIATLTLNGATTFTGNTATKNGGAIYNSGTLTLADNVSFVENGAASGGAIFNTAGGSVIIGENAIFKDNTAAYSNGTSAPYGGSDIKNYGYVKIGDNAQFIRSTYQDAINNDDVYDTGIFTMNGSQTIIGNNAVFRNIAQALNNEANTTHTIGNGAVFDNNGSVITNFGGAYTIGDNATFKNSQFMTLANKSSGSSITVGKNALFENNSNPVFHLGSGDWKYMNGNGAVANNDVAGTTMTFGSGLTVKNNNAAGKGVVYNVGSMTFNGSAFTGNTSAQGGAIYNSGTMNFYGENNFAGNIAGAVANDIHNTGNLNIASGTTTLDGGITGTGALTVADGATLNIETASIEQNSMALDGALNATLLNTNKFASLDVAEFTSETGAVNLSLKGTGTYKVFKDSVFGGTVVADSDMFAYNWNDNGDTITVSMKPVEEIAANTGLKSDTAAAVSHVAEAASKSDSAQLQDLSLKMQEKLAENTPEAKAVVEHATKAINPEKESVVQFVSTSVQKTVVNLASARMTTPIVGRSGGDVEFTKGGVWAQGLFNKSKQADAFNGYTRGIALGMDGTINKDWTIGAGYSYAHSDISGTARDTKINSNTIFLYGQYKPAEWYVNAIANYTMSDYSERGTILDSIAVTGDYKVNSFGGALAAGYDFDTGITPELGLRYMHVNANDYANSYGIKTHMDASNFLTGVIGARYAFDVAATKNITFAPQLSAAMKYDMLSDKNVATVTMPGVNAYTIDGNRLNRFGGEFGIGLGMQYRELKVSVNYDIDVRKDYTSQTGMLKFRYNF